MSNHYPAEHDRHHDEPRDVPIYEVDRRSFLKLAGFTFAGSVLAGCQPAKVEKVIPFLIQPEEVTPGLAYWYSTTCDGCNAGCGVLAKNRDGRPIKLEGNPDHPISKGGLCAIGQASLLSLYDSHRLKNPITEGKEATWDIVDGGVIAQLASIRKMGGAVRFLSGTITSPTMRAMIRRFLEGFKDGRHVEYDPLSCSAILDAHRISHGARILPRYRFERATTIVSFDADFLGTWISPVEFTAGYRAGRKLDAQQSQFSYHAQIESRLSLTGSNADTRICLSPEESTKFLGRLAAIVTERSGRPLEGPSAGDATFENKVRDLADRLWESRGKSLVVHGTNDIRQQLLTNAINQALGNYGATLDIEQPSHQFRGDDGRLQDLLAEVESGKVSALFVAGVNPIYDLPDGSTLAEQLKKIPLVVSFAVTADETASAATSVCPVPHALESWSDGEAVAGVVSITQPTIQPLMKSRPLIESLSVWMGKPASAYELIQSEWERTIFKRQSEQKSFASFWDKSVENGCAEVKPSGGSMRSFDSAAVMRSLKSLEKGDAPSKEGLTLLLHPSMTMLDGRHAHNPWLQELPDPVTKIVWDNYASLSSATAGKIGVEEGDVVKVLVEDSDRQHRTIELPVHIQPGQHDSVVAIALGYGRRGTDRFTNIGPQWLQSKPTVPAGELVGRNAAPLLEFRHGHLSYGGFSAAVERLGREHTLAATQEYDSLREPNLLGEVSGKRRRIVQETTLAAYKANPAAGSFPKHAVDSMWADDHQYSGHRWGMAIDLSACTGCSACVVGCQAENNIPVVGKDEVRRNRELTWLRIDRYYEEENGEFSVSHQPMMCQHCANAPCETVCPVLATVHNNEGLNQQVYNRCVGTRYCANNCPYKVRRFNWFQYPRGDDLQKMVLNPDVTVRDRGVMEKCSFCVQRIQLAKIEAKRDGRTLRDGEIKPACAQSCPAQAIVFGDMNDPQSEISKKMNDPRSYRVLEEIGVRPSVSYLTLVKNRSEKDGGEDHA